MSIWDDEDLDTGGNYWKAENEGASIEGTIIRVSKKKFDDDDKSKPVLDLRVAGEKDPIVVTASQVSLASQLAERRPLEGDWIKITYDGKQGRSKKFTVEHRSAEKAAPVTAAPAADADPTA